MTVIKTNFSVLMQLATAVGQAKKNNDPVALAKAQKEHDEYVEICKIADEIDLNVAFKDL